MKNYAKEMLESKGGDNTCQLTVIPVRATTPAAALLLNIFVLPRFSRFHPLCYLFWLLAPQKWAF